MASIIRVVLFVRKLVLWSTILFILYHLTDGSISLGYFLDNFIDVFQHVKGVFLFGAAVLLIQAAGVMAMFHQREWFFKFLVASIILIILAGYAGFSPEDSR